MRTTRRDRQARRCGLATALLAVTVLGLTSCGVDDAAGTSPSQESKATATPETTTSTSTTTTTEPEPSISNPTVYRFEKSFRGGYTTAVTIEVGRVSAPKVAPVDVTSCAGFNPDTDAAVPFSVEIENTTPEFEHKPYIELIVERYPMNITFSIAFDFGCEITDLYGGNLPSIGPSEALQPNESMKAMGAVVIHDYYTPANPTGDPELASAFLQLIGSKAAPTNKVVTIGGRPCNSCMALPKN